MLFYAVCKECGFSFRNKEEGIYYCPQCKKNQNFLKLELFDGVKPSKIHEHD
jgi:Zn finger protein HypA/HybF involved in hydrogenase expression